MPAREEIRREANCKKIQSGFDVYGFAPEKSFGAPQIRAATQNLWAALEWYHGTLVHMTDDLKLLVERVQTGVRIEKRILKVLKAFAEYHDMTLGDVLEGIVLHAFDGKTPFSAASLERIRDLKKFYELDLDSSASHRLKEIKAKSPRKRTGEK